MVELLKQGSYTRTYGAASDGTHACFFLKPVEDPLATAQQGRPIFNDVEFVEMFFPGDPTKKPVFKVNDEHRQRWPEQYKAFKAGQEMAVQGTPLEQWALLKPSQVLELKALGFRSVEDVAAMSDLAMQKIHIGGRMLKAHAEAFLDDAKAQALSTQLAAQNDRQASEIAALNHKVEELSRLVAQQHQAHMQRLDAPDAIAGMIPGVHDPIEQAKQGQLLPGGVDSSLNSLPAPRKRRQEAAASA